MAPTDCSIPIFHPFVLTAGGAQGPTTTKVYELLRHKPGPDDVEEARQVETSQLQITLGVILLRYAANMAKADAEKARDIFFSLALFFRYCSCFGLSWSNNNKVFIQTHTHTHTPSYALRALNNQQVTYGVRRTLLAHLSHSKPQKTSCPMCQQR